MNFIRGSLLVLFCVLFSISILLTGIFATLNASLNYENVKPQIKSFIKEIIEKEVNKTIIDEQTKILQIYCKETDNEYSFYDETTNHTFVIPCETISKGTDEIINVESDILIDKYFYAEYNCKFLNCIEKSPIFLISQHAKDFWKKQFYIFLIVSVLLAILIFLLVENKKNFPLITGFLMVFSFLPLVALIPIARFFISGIAATTLPFNLEFVALIFFGEYKSVFLTGFIIGTILIAIGIFWELIIIGLKIEHWFEKKGDDE